MVLRVLLLIPLLALFTLLPADTPRPQPVLIDTDIGAYPDDAFALALALTSPELEIVGLTTVGEDAEDRAWLACRFLTQVGVKEMPVAAGLPTALGGKMDGQIQYRRHPAAIFNRTLKPSKDRAPDLMAKLVAARPNEITLVCLGPLTNVAKFIQDHPETAKKLRSIVIAGGSIERDYEGRKNTITEWNLQNDGPAAKVVFASGIPMRLVPLDSSVDVTMQSRPLQELFDVRNMLTLQVQNLFELSNRGDPARLFDVAAIAGLTHEKHFTWKTLAVTATETGRLNVGEGKGNVRVAMKVQPEEVERLLVQRLRDWGKESPPRVEKNPSKLIERGNFPVRVHAFEDYETNIESRWWMSGLLAGGSPPETGKRICRDMLTQDFDDRQGDLKTLYRAVIFNPVPGPPMGPRTRLSFRYRLVGTGTLRVQLYSLTNGYHRYLSLHGLPEGKWLDACVDMTDMRRPDGTGGPLAKDERIDDIQFYVPARAHVEIDEMTLFEAAADGEKRPFPRRVAFTGWFDTGKQGKEWPGDFEIVPHEAPRTWKAAHSIADPAGKPILRVDLRGERPLDTRTELSFHYRTKGDQPVEVELRQHIGSRSMGTAKIPASAEWRTITLPFDLPKVENPAANEIRFRPADGNELWLDDLLLYTPGK